MELDTSLLEWTRRPREYRIEPGRVEIVTDPHTDLWQRTYYRFRNDTAPVLQLRTARPMFTFQVKAEFNSAHRFDQCGIVLYLNADNWLKASVEYEDSHIQHLGSVVTNHGYSDWATTAIPAGVNTMWYRLSRRKDDFRIDCSEDGVHFSQMRVCHLLEGGGEVRFGVYACSPEDSSFRAVFTRLELMECQWPAHDGQPPDDL